MVNFLRNFNTSLPLPEVPGGIEAEVALFACSAQSESSSCCRCTSMSSLSDWEASGHGSLGICDNPQATFEYRLYSLYSLYSLPLPVSGLGSSPAGEGGRPITHKQTGQFIVLRQRKRSEVRFKCCAVLGLLQPHEVCCPHGDVLFDGLGEEEWLLGDHRGL